MKSFNQDSRCPRLVPPEYMLQTLPLEPLRAGCYACRYACVFNYTENNSSRGISARLCWSVGFTVPNTEGVSVLVHNVQSSDENALYSCIYSFSHLIMVGLIELTELLLYKRHSCLVLSFLCVCFISVFAHAL
jgi:hypothetical protein